MKIKLNADERRIERELEAGEWKPVSPVRMEKTRAAARASAALRAAKVNPMERINIRLVGGDIEKLKERARELGMPYQVLAASVLHQVATEKLVLRLTETE